MNYSYLQQPDESHRKKKKDRVKEIDIDESTL